jgi:hypothetical protein
MKPAETPISPTFVLYKWIAHPNISFIMYRKFNLNVNNTFDKK